MLEPGRHDGGGEVLTAEVVLSEFLAREGRGDGAGRAEYVDVLHVLAELYLWPGDVHRTLRVLTAAQNKPILILFL